MSFPAEYCQAIQCILNTIILYFEQIFCQIENLFMLNCNGYKGNNTRHTLYPAIIVLLQAVAFDFDP